MHSVSILLVDDSPLFLHSVARFLQQSSPDEVVVVGTAGDGEEALTRARQLRPEVILLDMRMPGLSGLETLPLLRDALPEVGIIAVSLMDMNVYRQAALTAGADAFVSKATLDVDLLPAIRRVVRQRALIDISGGIEERKAIEGGGRPSAILPGLLRSGLTDVSRSCSRGIGRSSRSRKRGYLPLRERRML